MKGLFVFLFVGFFVGCTPAGLVTITQPPKPAIAAPMMASQPEFGAVSVTLSAGGLSFGIDKLDFRIKEIRFENTDGGWTTMNPHTGLLSLKNEAQNIELVTTKLPVGDWKSVAVVIDRVYANYNKSAGGPLNVSENELLVVSASFGVSAEEATSINLTLDTPSSIWKDDTGRWFFVPVLSAE